MKEREYDWWWQKVNELLVRIMEREKLYLEGNNEATTDILEIIE